MEPSGQQKDAIRTPTYQRTVRPFPYLPIPTALGPKCLGVLISRLTAAHFEQNLPVLYRYINASQTVAFGVARW